MLRTSPDAMNASDQIDKTRTLWDPLNAWPAGQKWIWAILATFAVIVQGPLFLQSFRVTWNSGNDFFQDWASARNVLEGRPAYLPLSESLTRHYPKTELNRRPQAQLRWNAHPPTSIVATLPLAFLDYPVAGTVWNVMSLIATAASLRWIAREWNLRVSAWSISPILALGLLCNPIRTQISQGQWNAPILMLLILAWVADRREHPLWAGLCMGFASALKLFPLFILINFAIRRRWRALIAATSGFIVLNLATAAILGAEAYSTYLHEVLPSLQVFQSDWDNCSLSAFWMKNFAVGASHFGLYAGPLIRAPLLARVGMVLSSGAILAISCFLIAKLARWDRRTGSVIGQDFQRDASLERVTDTLPVAGDGALCRGQGEPRCDDLSYSLTLVAMLLLAPVCWDHYLLLLSLPLALIWARLGPSSRQRIAFLILTVMVWLGPYEIWKLGGIDLSRDLPGFQDAPPATLVIRRPLFVPVFLSLHFYALLGCYAWLVFLAVGKIVPAKGRHSRRA
jgi:hypothetical protein